MDLEKFRLTEEGKRYLRDGFPERKLVELLEREKILDIKKAKELVYNFSIALQWAKKNKWVEVKDGKLVFLKKSEKTPEEHAIEKLVSGKEISESLLKTLLSRKLVEEVKADAFSKAEKLVGKEITNLTEELIKTGLWKKVKLKPYNVGAVGKKIFIGKHQPYNAFLLEVRQKLIELGFREMTGPIIELEFWNFDALYQAQNHPSRDWAQTYSLKNPKVGALPRRDIVERVKSAHESGWKTGSTGWRYTWDPKKAAKLMPRAHDTAISPRYLSGFSGKIEIPGKYFSLVRCFRPDVIDATHGVEFNQLGGFIVDKNLTLKSLFGILKEIVQEITGFDKVRFKPDYFPFTEPSLEVSAKHPEMGWMERAGAGIFRPELTEPLGVKEPVIAWGFGIDRLAMMRLNIHDIRDLFSRDLDWLRKKEVV
jgi:phenylalanyl-tRNA synthetase alpha chain